MTHEVIALSEKIWAAKLANDTSSVAQDIADNAHFVHMGITFDKVGELAAFDDKIFIYKNVHVSFEKVEDYGNTAIVFKKLVLIAQVGDNTVENPFVITEVFTKGDSGWCLVAETYTRIATDYDTYKFQ